MNNNIIDISWGKICSGEDVISDLYPSDIRSIEEIAGYKVLAVFRRKPEERAVRSKNLNAFVNENTPEGGASREYPDVRIYGTRAMVIYDFAQNHMQFFDTCYYHRNAEHPYVSKYDVLKSITVEGRKAGRISNSDADAIVRMIRDRMPIMENTTLTN